MHGRTQKALALQMSSLQISLHSCFMCFGPPRHLFLSLECDHKMLLASCPFNLPAVGMLDLEDLGLSVYAYAILH